MSRLYEMHVEISGFNPEKRDAIHRAAEKEWPFEDWDMFSRKDAGACDSACTEGSLCGGESDEEFAKRLTAAIWQANEAYCQVTVQAIYLEDLPHEDYCFEQADYQEWQQKQQPQPA